MDNFNASFNPTEIAPPDTAPLGNALRGEAWDEAKARVQKVYGRDYVCFAFLINGSCKCPMHSHLGHPEEQRGAFGVNYAGTPPPSELVTGGVGMKRQLAVKEDMFNVKRRRLNQGALRGPEWDEAKQRVVKAYGKQFVCFAFLINGTCRCDGESRLNHPEEQRGGFGVNYQGRGTTPPPSRGIPTRSTWGNSMRPMSRASSFIGGGGGGYQEPSPFHSPPAPLKGTDWEEAVARVKATFGGDFICFSYLINGTCNCGSGSRFKHPDGEAGAYGVYFQSLPRPGAGQFYNPVEDAFYPPQQQSPRSMGMDDRFIVRRPGPKQNLKGDKWEEAMERVKEHFGDSFVCFSYLINGHCKCESSKKFPHPPGLAGSFGVNMLDENQKCFDFNVNGSCQLQGCPSKHDYWTLDEAITTMRLSGKETDSKVKMLARKISTKLDELETESPELTSTFEVLRKLLPPLTKRSDRWQKDSAQSQLDLNTNQEGANLTQPEAYDLTTESPTQPEAGFHQILTDSQVNYNPQEDGNVKQEAPLLEST